MSWIQETLNETNNVINNRQDIQRCFRDLFRDIGTDSNDIIRYFNYIVTGIRGSKLTKDKSKEQIKVVANTKNQDGDSLLKLASSKSTQYLLQMGADPNLRDHKGQTLLFNRLQDKYYKNYAYNRENKVQKIGFLLQYGADSNIRDHRGCTALFSANRYSSLKLLEAGADPNIVNSRGQTALYWACKHQDTAKVKLLLEYGAKTSLDRSKKSVYQIADKEKYKILGQHDRPIVKRYAKQLFYNRGVELDPLVEIICNFVYDVVPIPYWKTKKGRNDYIRSLQKIRM